MVGYSFRLLAVRLNNVPHVPSSLHLLRWKLLLHRLLLGCSSHCTGCLILLIRLILSSSSRRLALETNTCDCTKYPLHEAVVLTLKINHPTPISLCIQVPFKGSKVICAVCGWRDVLNVVHKSVWWWCLLEKKNPWRDYSSFQVLASDF